MRVALRHVAMFLASAASPVAAQVTDPDASEAAARAALAVLGIAATPNDTLPSVSVLSATGDTSSFRSTQLRGGTNAFDNDLYIEGLVAYQRYNPTLIFPEIAPGTEVDVTWASVAGTVGIGWDFRLAGDWKIRPSGHLSLGHVTADAFLVDLPIPLGTVRADEVVDGSLDAYGLGGSLSIFRDATFGPWQAEYKFRRTYLQFHPINEPQAGNATASSNQTTLFSRHRYPLQDTRVFNLASKLVLDAGLVLYHGDGATVLRTDWAATVGVGLELETETLGLPVVQAGRVMVNAVVAEEFDGLSVGFGLRF